jgi:hypothetical protein
MIQRRSWWAAAFLPALLLRALIPAGFMPAVGEGSLALVFCEPGALVAAGPNALHHHPGHDRAGQGPHSASSECPFAQSAAPSLPTLAAPLPAHPLSAHVPALRREDPALCSVPLRYTAPLPAGLVPQRQLNARIEQRESGLNADVDNSGASLFCLSPGVGFQLSTHVDGFAFVQLPVYQRVNGLQLEPRVLGSVGFHYRF